MLRHWIILVSLNAPASFVAAVVSGHQLWTDYVEMILGIITFVVIALGVDAWLTKRDFMQLRTSFVVATKIKIGLQLLPFIEVLAGAVAAGIVGLLFGWDNRINDPTIHYGQTYLMTVFTGAVLMMVVFIITPVVFFFKTKAK